MGSLTAAYSIAWFALGMYVIWLSFHSRRLARRLEVLESLAKADETQPKQRAA